MAASKTNTNSTTCTSRSSNSNSNSSKACKTTPLHAAGVDAGADAGADDAAGTVCVSAIEARVIRELEGPVRWQVAVARGFTAVCHIHIAWFGGGGSVVSCSIRISSHHQLHFVVNACGDDR